MSILRVNKFQQLEGGVFNKSNNLVNIFVEPQSGVIDMTKSYLELETKFKEGVEYVTEGIILGSADEDGTEEVNYTPACLIKNCKLSSEKKGLLEEHRFINILNQSLETVEKTVEQHDGGFVYGRADPVLLNEAGIANLQVPLSDILGCGKVSQFPADMMGKLQLQLEFENKLATAYKQNVGVPLVLCPCGDVINATGAPLPVTTLTTTGTFQNPTDITDFCFPVGSTCSITYTRTDQGAPGNVQRVIELATLNANNTVTIQFTEPVQTLPAGVNMTTNRVDTNGIDGVAMNNLEEEDPRDVIVQNVGVNAFNVGDVIDVCYAVLDGAILNYGILTTSITEITAGNEYTLAGVLPNGEIRNISVTQHNWNPVDYEIQKVNLVLYCMPMMKSPSSLVYGTYHLEMTNMLETSDFRQQYDIEENCLRALLLTPAESMVSTPDNATSFRLSVDNVDTTNRDVVLNYTGDNTLYYDRLRSQLESIRSLVLRNSNTNVFVIPQKLPVDGRRHALNIRLYSDNNMSAKVVYVFKHILMEVM